MTMIRSFRTQGQDKISFLGCKNAKTRKFQCNANAMKKTEKFASHCFFLGKKETGQIIDQSLFRSRIRIALPALLLRNDPVNMIGYPVVSLICC
jgi:hypothetical protein